MFSAGLYTLFLCHHLLIFQIEDKVFNQSFKINPHGQRYTHEYTNIGIHTPHTRTCMRVRVHVHTQAKQGGAKQGGLQSSSCCINSFSLFQMELCKRTATNFIEMMTTIKKTTKICPNKHSLLNFKSKITRPIKSKVQINIINSSLNSEIPSICH